MLNVAPRHYSLCTSLLLTATPVSGTVRTAYEYDDKPQTEGTFAIVSLKRLQRSRRESEPHLSPLVDLPGKFNGSIEALTDLSVQDKGIAQLEVEKNEPKKLEAP